MLCFFILCYSFYLFTLFTSEKFNERTEKQNNANFVQYFMRRLCCVQARQTEGAGRGGTRGGLGGL